MAVPTISSVSPSTAFTGGQLVRIFGTNFRVAYDPEPNPTGPVADPLPTVAVTIGGRRLRQVAVVSATEIQAHVLPLDPGTYGITVQNLDPDGEPIPGEATTVAALLTTKRADLARNSDFTRLERSLITELQRQVLENVHKTTATDFDSTPDGAVDVVVEQAKLPMLTIQGPQVVDNREYDSELSHITELQSGEILRRKTFKTVNLTYRFVGMDNKQARNMNLFTLMLNFLQNNPFLEMDRDGGDASKGTIQYEMAQVGEFTTFAGASESDVRGFSGSLVIRGFQVEDVVGFAEQMVAERGYPVDNVIIEAP
jgi:hypothetical protein